MQEILTTFGVDWRLLVINAFNFVLVMGALWYFLYAPVMKMLEERRQKVSDGVRDAELAKHKLEEIEVSRSSVLGKAGKEADEVISHARAAAQKAQREALAEAERAAAGVLSEAQAQARELKEQTLEESRREVAKLIVLGVEKTLAAGVKSK
jgi:F-type H+-transporting ATPase subunit b